MALYNSHTDEALVTLIAEGNNDAFTELYDRYWKLLFYVAFKRLQSIADAEEVVQEVFVGIWARRATLQINRSVKYYLSAAAQYQVMGVFARRERRVLQGLEEGMGIAGADRALLFKELEVQIEEVVGALPERCQVVYRMSREEGLSNRAIAEKLGIAEKTVENQITKALGRIRDGLGYMAYAYALCHIKDLL